MLEFRRFPLSHFSETIEYGEGEIISAQVWQGQQVRYLVTNTSIMVQGNRVVVTQPFDLTPAPGTDLFLIVDAPEPKKTTRRKKSSE
jgi:hypothetical protein